MRPRSRLPLAVAAALSLAIVGVPAAAQSTPVTVGALMKTLEPELVRLSTGPTRLTRTTIAGPGALTEIVSEHQAAPAITGGLLYGEDGTPVAAIHRSGDLLFTRRGPDGAGWAATVNLADPWFPPDPLATDPAADAALLAPLVATLHGPTAELVDAIGRMTTFTSAPDPACPETCLIVTGATADPVADPSAVEIRTDGGALTGAQLAGADGSIVVLAWDAASGELLATPAPLTAGLPDGLVPAGIAIGQVAIAQADAHRLIGQALGRAWAGEIVVTDRTLKGQTLLGQVVTQHAASGDANVKRTAGDLSTGLRTVGRNAWYLYADGVWEATKDLSRFTPDDRPVPEAWIAPLRSVRWSGISRTTGCATGGCLQIAGFIGAFRSLVEIDEATGRLIHLDLRGVPGLASGTRRDITFNLPAKPLKIVAPTVTARTPSYKVTDSTSNTGVICQYSDDGVQLVLTGILARSPRLFWPGAPGVSGTVGWRLLLEVKNGSSWTEVLRSPEYRSLATSTVAATMPSESFTIGVGPLSYLAKPYRGVLVLSWYKPDGKSLKSEKRSYVNYAWSLGNDALGVSTKSCPGVTAYPGP